MPYVIYKDVHLSEFGSIDSASDTEQEYIYFVGLSRLLLLHTFSQSSYILFLTFLINEFD